MRGGRGEGKTGRTKNGERQAPERPTSSLLAAGGDAQGSTVVLTVWTVEEEKVSVSGDASAGMSLLGHT